eukprot:141512-Chlamydomonas_euryale.AAC.1
MPAYAPSRPPQAPAAAPRPVPPPAPRPGASPKRRGRAAGAAADTAMSEAPGVEPPKPRLQGSTTRGVPTPGASGAPCPACAALPDGPLGHCHACDGTAACPAACPAACRVRASTCGSHHRQQQH